MPLKTEHGKLWLGVAPNVCDGPKNEEADWLAWTNFTANDVRVDFTVLPVTVDLSPPDHETKADAFLPTTGSDLAFPSSTWRESIILRASEWISGLLADAETRDIGRACLVSQVGWAQHCGCSAVILPSPTLSSPATVATDLVPWASALTSLFASQRSTPKSTTIYVEIPNMYEFNDIIDGSKVLENGWHVFSTLSALLGPQHELGVALRLVHKGDYVSTRWNGEKVGFVLCSQDHFLINNAGYPVLNSFDQHCVMDLAQRDARVCICTEAESAERSLAFTSLAANYLRHLFKSLPPLTPNLLSRRDYRDYLQLPLQPLADDLESEVYECFEMDPVKYELYERACQHALQSRIQAGHKFHHIAVAGGGRGPLMTRMIRSLQDIPLSELMLTIVEKNVNAVRTLTHLKSIDDDPVWRHVEIVLSDMREWNPTKPVDILISELLGSFGDNELSPECLDGVEKNLSDSAICIPQKYCSSVQPICCPKLFKAALDNGSLSTGFIVELYSYFPIARSGPQDCFQFSHPSRTEFLPNNLHNQRYKQLNFECAEAATCNGFACYFSAELFPGTVCSIDPRNASPDMSSWYPFYLPLQQPVPVRKHDIIRWVGSKLESNNANAASIYGEKQTGGKCGTSGACPVPYQQKSKMLGVLSTQSTSNLPQRHSAANYPALRLPMDVVYGLKCAVSAACPNVERGGRLLRLTS